MTQGRHYLVNAFDMGRDSELEAAVALESEERDRLHPL